MYRLTHQLEEAAVAKVERENPKSDGQAIKTLAVPMDFLTDFPWSSRYHACRPDFPP